MAFGAANQASGASVTLTGVPAGATIVAFLVANNGTASAAGASDSQGSYTTIGSVLSSSFATLILTNANAGSHTITGSFTGDTVYCIVAAYWTGVGGVDNAGAAHAQQLIGASGTGSDALTTGSFTTSTANATVAVFAFNDTDTTAITAGTTPLSMTSEYTVNAGGTDYFLIEDNVWSGSGAINPTAGVATSKSVAMIGFALAPAGGGTDPMLVGQMCL